MSFFNNNFDDLFSGLFNRFNRPVLDQQYYNVYRKEGKGYIIVFNALGIKKEDISVNIEQPNGKRFKTLHVKGQTDIDEIEYHNSIDMAVELRFEEEIQDVSYKVADGLLYVYLKAKTVEDNRIEAKYIENDDAGLDW